MLLVGALRRAVLAIVVSALVKFFVPLPDPVRVSSVRCLARHSPPVCCVITRQDALPLLMIPNTPYRVDV